MQTKLLSISPLEEVESHRGNIQKRILGAEDWKGWFQELKMEGKLQAMRQTEFHQSIHCSKLQ